MRVNVCSYCMLVPCSVVWSCLVNCIPLYLRPLFNMLVHTFLKYGLVFKDLHWRITSGTNARRVLVDLVSVVFGNTSWLFNISEPILSVFVHKYAYNNTTSVLHHGLLPSYIRGYMNAIDEFSIGFLCGPYFGSKVKIDRIPISKFLVEKIFFILQAVP